MGPNSDNQPNNAMKLSQASQIQQTSGVKGSEVDHLFIDWLPKLLVEQKNLVKTVQSIYQWNLTRDAKVVSTWTLDLKNGSGSVYSGPPKGCKPDCAITMDENDAQALLDGTMDPAKAFIGGKMKISGNVSSAHKFQQFWSEQVVKVRRYRDSIPKTTTQSTVSSDGNHDDTALLQSIPTDGLKSDIVFNIIRMRMNEEPDLVKAMKFVIQFNITKDRKTIAVWTTDTKVEGGQVYRSAPKVKPDAVVTIEDENYVNILFGKLNPQRAFMTGKIGVKGNILLLQKLDTFWNQVQGSRKDPELPIVRNIMLKDPLKPGLRSEVIVFDLIQKIVRLPNLLSDGTIVRFNITKDGKLVSVWLLKYISGQRLATLERATPEAVSDIDLTIDDDDLVRLAYNTLKLDSAVSHGRVKYRGDASSLSKLSQLFTTPIIKAKL